MNFGAHHWRPVRALALGDVEEGSLRFVPSRRELTWDSDEIKNETGFPLPAARFSAEGLFGDGLWSMSCFAQLAALSIAPSLSIA